MVLGAHVWKGDLEIVAMAVSRGWANVNMASEEAKTDESIARAVFAQSRRWLQTTAIGLQISLLSGRGCMQFCRYDCPLGQVWRFPLPHLYQLGPGHSMEHP